MDAYQHAPPPTGKGLFWAIRQDWKLPVVLGGLFIILTVLALSPHFYSLDRDQRRTFGIVVERLRESGFVDISLQRESVLSRKESVFYWRGIAWRSDIESGRRPFLFAVKINAAEGGSVSDWQILPYDQDLADRLGVYQQINE